MNSLFRAALIVSTLALGSCATLGGGGSGGGLPSIAQVQTAAVAVCRFLPTASSIAAILSASPYLTTAEAVAQAICNAVAPSASRKRGVPMVNGVPVHGRFVN